MAKEYKSSWWVVELPSDWSAKEEEDCVTLLAERGVGALQISAFRRDGESVTHEDLNDLARDGLVDGVIPRDVSCGDFRGMAISNVRDGKFWRKMWLRSDTLLLYVTYNCAAEDRSADVEAVNRMLSSLKSRIGGEA